SRTPTTPVEGHALARAVWVSDGAAENPGAGSNSIVGPGHIFLNSLHAAATANAVESGDLVIVLFDDLQTHLRQPSGAAPRPIRASVAVQVVADPVNLAVARVGSYELEVGVRTELPNCVFESHEGLGCLDRFHFLECGFEIELGVD